MGVTPQVLAELTARRMSRRKSTSKHIGYPAIQVIPEAQTGRPSGPQYRKISLPSLLVPLLWNGTHTGSPALVEQAPAFMVVPSFSFHSLLLNDTPTGSIAPVERAPSTM